MLNKAWVSDGITREEAGMIQGIYRMARPIDESFAEKTVAATLTILDMPFLESISPGDSTAVGSLERLAHANTKDFLKLLKHPKIADGITDEETKIVSLLGATYQYRPQSAEFLLKGTGVYQEERVIDLPNTGNTSLAVVRIRDQQTPSMDYLEHAVRAVEEFIAEPFPVSYVALFFDDAVFPDSGGTNFGTHMAMQLPL